MADKQVCHAAEMFACQCMRKESNDSAHLLQLFDLLPTVKPPTEGRAATEGKAFGTGLWVHGGMVGLRNSCTTFATSTKVMTRFVKQRCPGLTFSSIVIMEGVETFPHVDSHNDPSSENAVFGLGPPGIFSGGEVWIEDSSGSVDFKHEEVVLKGRLLPVIPGPACFCARKVRHATLPNKGRRVVLIAFSVRDSRKLDSQRSWFGIHAPCRRFDDPPRPDSLPTPEVPTGAL